jgi:hypothetical protein
MTAPQTIASREDTNAVSVGSTRLLGRVLVACEYSGSVRDAFARMGWDAWSCDILPSETDGNHYQGDVQTAPEPLSASDLFGSD